MPLYLTTEEQAELDRQNRLAENPHFHDELKCGAKLELRFYYKRHTKFHRQFCATHQALVNMSGWELGYTYGQSNDDLKKNGHKDLNKQTSQTCPSA